MYFLKVPLIFLLFSFCTISLSSSNPGRTISWWCRLVPHPQPCLSYLSPHAHNLPHRSDFYTLSVKAALDLSILAHTRLENEPSGDCRNLLGNTVLQLNRTLSLPGGATSHDSQTWLSAVHTNLHACRASDSSAFVRYEVVSQLLSNCLAINGAEAVGPRRASLVAGRKLLYSRPDIVVSEDGSGHFRTIKEALGVAGIERRGTNRRIVVYVKAGVYAENLEVVSSLNDITIAGDGKGRTIITGSRSAASGYTTFNSATLSKIR